MKKIIFPLVLSLAIVLSGVGAFGSQSALAQTATFPSGCSSALGYSVTTGLPCNGSTDDATMGPLPGCTTALGYSITNGAPCSGANVAISFLAGCSSIYGYSVITGAACNGTTVASIQPGTPFIPGTTFGDFTSPGFPATGFGGYALSNILLLVTSGLVASVGSYYIARRTYRLL
jgi:hypothetical protein